MTKYCLILLLLLISVSCFAQVRKSYDVPDKWRLDSCSYDAEEKYHKENHLREEHLRQLLEASHVRIIFDNQLVDVSTDDFQRYNGVITLYVNGYIGSKKKISRNQFNDLDIVYKKEIMSGDTAYNIYKLAMRLKSSPAREEVKNWHINRDRNFYAMEIATPYDYVYKDWQDLYTQDSTVKDMQLIAATVDSITAILSINDRWLNFIHSTHLLSYSYRTTNIDPATKRHDIVAYVTQIVVTRSYNRLQWLWFKVWHRRKYKEMLRNASKAS